MLSKRLGWVIGAAWLSIGALLAQDEEGGSRLWRPFRYPQEETPAVNREEAGAPAIGENWVVPRLGMEFIWIPSLSAWVGKYEVTNQEYRSFKPRYVGQNFNLLSLNDDRQPLVNVNHADATAYAEWLTQRERRAGRLPDGYRYRLPTALEWTACCQCGEERTYPWGNGMPPRRGNYHGVEGAGSWGKINGYNDGFPVTCPVERSGENEWGLYGVGGNVWEITIKTAKGMAFDAWRGGSWANYHPYHLNALCTYRFDAAARRPDVGFRLVLSHVK